MEIIAQADGSTWHVYYDDVVVQWADGTVHPLYTRESSLSTSQYGTGQTNPTATVDISTATADVNNPAQTTYYYHGDHIGSSRLMTSGGGWPVWQGTFLPYGEEYNAQMGTNHYKFTGQERDDESGLDYFGARYYSNGLGRFLSTDPVHFQASMLIDPQRFNLYAYVRNNPLRFIDPKGEAIELTGDEKQRQKEMDGLKSAVGKQAGEYLYQNKVVTTNKDGSTTTRYFVGILSGGPSGSGSAFGSLNSVAKSLGQIVGAPQVAQLAIVPAGTKIGEHEINTMRNLPILGNIGGTPGITSHGVVSMLDPSVDPGPLDGSVMSDKKDSIIDYGIIVMHELGHASWEWHLPGATYESSGERAIGLENEVRKLRNPNSPTRKVH